MSDREMNQTQKFSSGSLKTTARSSSNNEIVADSPRTERLSAYRSHQINRPELRSAAKYGGGAIFALMTPTRKEEMGTPSDRAISAGSVLTPGRT